MNTNSNAKKRRTSTELHHTTKSSQGFDPWIIWVTFRRSWTWALPIGLVLAGFTAVLVLQTFVPTYRATHLIEANDEFLIYKGVNPVYKDLARTEKALILNNIVLDPVLADPDLRWAPNLSDPKTAESNLKRNLSFSGGGNNARFGISYSDSDPKAAAAICNAVVASYMKFRDDHDSKRVHNIENWLAPEISKWEKEVENQRSKVKKLKTQTIGYSQDSQVSRLENNESFNEANELRRQIADLKIEIMFDEKNLAMLGKLEGVNDLSIELVPAMVAPEIRVQKIAPTQLEIDNQARLDPEVTELKRKIQRYEQTIAQMEENERVGKASGQFGAGHPTIRSQRKDYARFVGYRKAAKEKLKVVTEEARKRAADLLDELAESQYQRRLVEAKSNDEILRKNIEFQNKQKRSANYSMQARLLEAKKSKLAVLQPLYNDARYRLEQFGGATAELDFAESELDVSTGVLEKLRGRSAQIRTERRPDGAVRSLAPATVPRKAIEEIPYKKLGAACGVATLLPFLLGLFIEFHSLRITDSSMCDKNGLAVIGEIAQLPVGSRSAKGRRVFEESVDTLRAGLFLSIKTRDIRSIAVISSMSGEGKSSISSQLALSIAKATGKTVLLVDADLRCPDQHHIFGLDLSPGLSGLLSGRASFRKAVDKSHGDLIHILPAGKLTESPHRLINTERMNAFVDAALKKYAYVIIDTSPVLSAGESLAVAAAADASLLCVMRDVSRMDTVTKTRRRLEAAGANLVGTVFSGVSARQYAYRYGDYHYSLPASVSDQSLS